MCPTRHSLRFLALWAFAIQVYATSLDDQMTALLEWFRDRGGMFNSKLRIGPVDPDDPTSRIGMTAKQDIRYKELLFEIPREALFVPSEEVLKHAEDWWCETTYMLIREMKLGDKSEYAPYINYLLSQSHGQLPSAWSRNGKRLLEEVMYNVNDEQTIPPSGIFGRVKDWHKSCNGKKSGFEENAYLLLVQRGWDHHLIPVYDMISHRNGNWTNTESNSLEDGVLLVRAKRAIKAGEEIYMSYNFCADCGNRLKEYGTPEILRDYGFVEQYPQRWVFHEQDIWFDIDQKTNDDGSISFEVDFYDGPPDNDQTVFIEEELDRLVGLELQMQNTGVSKYEFETIKQFRDSAIIALSHAYSHLTDTNKTCTDSESCRLNIIRYDMLEPQEDLLPYNTPICDMESIFEFKTYDHEFDVVSSPYHNLVYFHDKTNKDTCFELDNIVQMCGCYRPHYHEMVVHFTARFVENVKRVVFVGGGDSMLLHEIMKYPSLELVVGLELDQKVTRSAFKHFGCQPHWENEKVQWWYGDASKSLLMLPKDYFGSFDMVLVDLSETVMSFLVTDELDIMEALSLLLKPEGVYVKNEHYLDDLSAVFDYTIQIHYDCPIICHQCLIMGSNKLDFLNQDKKDHEVNILLDKLDINKPRYDIIHDYRHNRTSTQKHCKGKDAQPEKEPEKQVRSPGILMVLEVEGTSANLSSEDKLSSILKTALDEQGVNVFSTVPFTTDGKVSLVIVTNVGYVVARTWPEHKYCAFDIHLWSSFDSHEGIKRALIAAVGGSVASSSSFRIVAGGMFGVSTWKQDDMSRGPRVTHICDEADTTVRDGKMDLSAVDIAVDECLGLAKDSDVIVAVLCGEESEICSSTDVAKTNEKVGKVVPLWTCPDVAGGNEYTENISDKMAECEKSLVETIGKSLAEDKKIRAVVIDSSAPFLMGRILHKIFKRNKKELFSEDVLFISAILDQSEEWKLHLMERFRKIVKWEPVFRAEVVVNSTDSKMELSLLSSGDELFFENLVNVRKNIDNRSGLVSEVRNIRGGLWKFNEDYKPSQFFLPSDYDESGPLKQWLSQQPLGHQTIFQLLPEEEHSDVTLTTGDIRHALVFTMTSMEYDLESKIELEEFTQIADGCVFVALWSGGSIVVLWDGRQHIDINLFTYVESIDGAKRFLNFFINKMKVMKKALHDEHPRGYGGVVNFLEDINFQKEHPHWAS